MAGSVKAQGGLPRAGAGASDALRKLESGELTLDAFLDYHAEEAVQHLRATVPADQLEIVKEALRGQLETDPVLRDLVRRATERAAGTGRR